LGSSFPHGCIEIHDGLSDFGKGGELNRINFRIALAFPDGDKLLRPFRLLLEHRRLFAEFVCQ